VTTRTKLKPRRAPAALAILLTGIAACAGCQGGVSGTPTALTVNSPASGDGGTGSGSASAVPSSASASPSPSASPSKSASPSPSKAAGTNALAGKVVVIDPGHDGGNETHAAEIAQLVPQGFGQEKACDTTGTNGDDGYSEHQFTFQTSLLVKSLLQARGLTVILTRYNDTGVGPCVNVRAEIGNNAHAAAAISIHADGGPTTGHGYQLLEATTSVGGGAIDAKSHQLAVDLHSTFNQESGLTASNYVGSDGYEPRDDIAGLNLSTVPKIMVECGNMRNASDLALEESAAGRERIAKAIADGIIAYLGVK
jgi:N-acetylmuramoyl-L-alanine amidase